VLSFPVRIFATRRPKALQPKAVHPKGVTVRVLVWLAAGSFVVGLLVGTVLASQQPAGPDLVTSEEAREMFAAQREGREWHADDGEAWAVAHATEVGAATAVLVFVVGLLAVIAVNSARPAPPLARP
jgi:hypothetical protein